MVVAHQEAVVHSLAVPFVAQGEAVDIAAAVVPFAVDDRALEIDSCGKRGALDCEVTLVEAGAGEQLREDLRDFSCRQKLATWEEDMLLVVYPVLGEDDFVEVDEG